MDEVTLLDIDPRVEPDPTFPGAHGIYLILSREPDPAWQQEFDRQWKAAPHGLKRRMTVVEDRIRVTVGGRDHLAEIMAFASELVDKTNRAWRQALQGEGGPSAEPAG